MAKSNKKRYRDNKVGGNFGTTRKSRSPGRSRMMALPVFPKTQYPGDRVFRQFLITIKTIKKELNKFDHHYKVDNIHKLWK
jgi:hypothetical protein